MTNPLVQILQRFDRPRVLVVGDFMLDRYVFGDAERISPEAPVPVLRVVERQDRVGGAGSVALNVAALGARAVCCGILGRDTFGDRIEALLRESSVSVNGLIRVGDRPTTTKTRLVGLAEHRHRQQILRVDDEIVRPLAPAAQQTLLDFLRVAVADCDVICLEDYAKGVLGESLCRSIIDLARTARKPVLVDPPRDRNWEKYRGATLMTPNRSELEIGVGRSVADDELDACAAALALRLELDCLVVTLGRDGARLVPATGLTSHFPTRPRAVYDNTGAGDAVLAMMAVALAAGASLDQAVPLANIAGGLEVGKFGCVPITRDEVMHEVQSGEQSTRGKLRGLAELLPELTARRQRGETVVFTNGCFDILHVGHVDLLERAKSLGNTLVVGINSDASVRSLGKGDDRPIRNQVDRARMLAALEAVDYVVVFDTPTPAALIESVAPDTLVKGGDWSVETIVGREFVEARGGRVVVVELVEGYSTTRELSRIRQAQASE
ncbi:MAG: D-glycero-beta-D-manno-heptose 1-phosphate adenylyltransferase [Phycisphaerales bacterium]|nr:D-glycero-beta-D-manno-heptose 1-phosphate adenylyltransferase [Phycisphaerales bacterium]